MRFDYAISKTVTDFMNPTGDRRINHGVLQQRVSLTDMKEMQQLPGLMPMLIGQELCILL